MLTQRDPFAELARMQNELFGRTGGGEARSGFRPPVDVFEDEDAIRLEADLPGVRSEDVHLDVEDGVLTVRGERKAERKNGGQVAERSYGGFARSFTLPNVVDFDKIEANMENGVLHVKLPKKEASRPKRIEVKGRA